MTEKNEERRGGLRALVAAGTGAFAVRTLVKQLARRTLGPVGLLITAFDAAVAVRTAVRAVHRWRVRRRLRHAGYPSTVDVGADIGRSARAGSSSAGDS